MSRRACSSGFTLIELLVGLALLSTIMVVLASLLIDSSKANKTQHMRAQAQSSARSTLALTIQKLRLAGWDPTGAGIATVGLDSDLSDAISYIDVFTDINADGDTDDAGETIRIRHNGDRVEWRETTTDPFVIVGVALTNDADGDGIPEPMFVPDVTPNPTRITVTVTAASSANAPDSDQPVRFTISSDVVLRNAG